MAGLAISYAAEIEARDFAFLVRAKEDDARGVSAAHPLIVLGIAASGVGVFRVALAVYEKLGTVTSMLDRLITLESLHQGKLVRSTTALRRRGTPQTSWTPARPICEAVLIPRDWPTNLKLA